MGTQTPPLSEEKSLTVTFDQVREPLTVYLTGLLGQPVTIVTDEIGQKGEGIRIRLPRTIAHHASRELNADKYWILAALQGAKYLYGSLTIEQQDLYSFESKLGLQKKWSETFFAHDMTEYFRKAFGDVGAFAESVFNAMESARLRYRLGSDYPGIDQTIEHIVEDAMGRRAVHDMSDIFLGSLTHRYGPAVAAFTATFHDSKGVPWNDSKLNALQLALFSKGQRELLLQRFSGVQELYQRLADILFVPASPVRHSLNATAVVLQELLQPEMLSQFQSGTSQPTGKAQPHILPLTGISSGLNLRGIETTYDRFEVKAETREAKRKGQGRFVYDEWDYTARKYDRNVVIVREVDSFYNPPPHEMHVKIYPSLVSLLKRELETLIPKGRHREFHQLRGVLHMPSIVRYQARRKAGMQPDTRVCYRWNEKRRDVAVAYLIDASRSTGYYPNPKAMAAQMKTIDMIQQGLLHLVRASEELEDAYAIFAYQSRSEGGDHITDSMTIKDFYEMPSLQTIQARTLGISPNNDNRDGAAIRHILYEKLEHHPARTKLFIHLNDGLPEDGASHHTHPYAGTWAIEDTKKALDEMKMYGVIPLSFSFAFPKDRESLQALWGKYITFVESPKQLAKGLSAALQRYTAD